MENQSVYQALMRSPQWKAWYEHAEKNHLFDVAETAECDWMSDKHFQAFIEHTIHQERLKWRMESL